MANFVIAATFIAVLVAWDLFGDLPPPLDVAGNKGSTVIVGLNRSAAWEPFADHVQYAGELLPDGAARTPPGEFFRTFIGILPSTKGCRPECAW
ncbi:hypothetical protein ABZT47_24735 [Sphaerisporangium sp. NPDC005289]|uniref:hypothetical protein n=1 Tax=Sphaerisporangium sp. NPDC005289 TaxID=3155247 RepID=UPI0033A196C2